MKPLQTIKTIHCRHCKMTHKMATPTSYYCPKVFGGWVNIRKKKAPKIVGYRKCFTHKLDGKWDWQCPVWFTVGIFANAMIKSARDFDTQEDAVDDMDATMKLFGVTKRTKNLNVH
jgi:hypothetical protein